MSTDLSCVRTTTAQGERRRFGTGWGSRMGHRAGIAALTSVVVAMSGAVVGAVGAQAVTGDPTVVTTAPGTTSVPVTAGKSRGSGLWGYVGDVETRRSGVTNYNYGLAFNPVDESLWVTDSGKYFYFGGSAIQTGSPVLMRFAKTGSDWAAGQYSGDGAYSPESASGHAGVGVNYTPLAEAQLQTGVDQPGGKLLGPRGISFRADGTAVVVDSDAYATGYVPEAKYVRLLSDITTVSGVFGNAYPNWSQSGNPGVLDFPVGTAVLKSGNILVTSQSKDLISEFTPDGVWVRNIPLDRPVGPVANAHYRAPYALTVDPVDGSFYVGYLAPGVIGHYSATGEFLQEFGQGNLPTAASASVTFAMAVDPVTRDLYVAQRTGNAYVFSSSGAYKGRFAGFGTGTGNGQTNTIRGINFDKRGFLYLTTSEGTAANRIEIFARTPDPVTNLIAVVAGSTATLSWDALATGVTADAQTPLRDYVVEVSTDEGATWTVTPTSTSTDTTASVPVAAGSLPMFRVSAWNEAGNGDPAIVKARDAVPTTLRPDVRTTAHNTPITVDVLTNDDQTPALVPGTLTLLDGDNPVTELAVTGGVYRVVEGAIRFTPTAGFSGTAPAVTYRVTNAEGVSSTTTVQVIVRPAAVDPQVPPVQKQPIISTRTSHARVVPGTAIRDRVTIRGFTPGRGARGSATLYGPFKKRAAARCTPANAVRTVAFTPVAGTATTPSVTVNRTGWYTWVARTTTDPANKAATHACGLASESTLVAEKSYQPPVVNGGFSGTLLERRAVGAPSRVVIPSLGVRAEMGATALRGRVMPLPEQVAEVSRLTNSAAPGDLIGTTVVAGHVSDRYDRPGALYRLAQVRKGAVIKVRTGQGTVRYRVTSVGSQPRSKKLPKRLFSTTGAHRLVLLSCTGRVTRGNTFHYTRNVYVVAKKLG